MALQLNLHTNIYYEAVEVLTFSPGLLCTFVFNFLFTFTIIILTVLG